jgi:hypothetical protein
MTNTYMKTQRTGFEMFRDEVSRRASERLWEEAADKGMQCALLAGFALALVIWAGVAYQAESLWCVPLVAGAFMLGLWAWCKGTESRKAYRKHLLEEYWERRRRAERVENQF